MRLHLKDQQASMEHQVSLDMMMTLMKVDKDPHV